MWCSHFSSRLRAPLSSHVIITATTDKSSHYLTNLFLLQQESKQRPLPRVVSSDVVSVSHEHRRIDETSHFNFCPHEVDTTYNNPSLKTPLQQNEAGPLCIPPHLLGSIFSGLHHEPISAIEHYVISIDKAIHVRRRRRRRDWR